MNYVNIKLNFLCFYVKYLFFVNSYVKLYANDKSKRGAVGRSPYKEIYNVQEKRKKGQKSGF